MLDYGSLVSVIIPVCNVHSYLAEAMDSVLRQTYSNLEIILIDDGSTDGSGKLCDDYALQDARVRVVHQENQGQSAARNVGLDIMSGDAVAFLDSDDAYDLTFIEKMLSAMLQKNTDAVVCQRTYHFTTGPLINENAKIIRLMMEPGIYDRASALRALADWKINGAVWNKLYKREVWKGCRFLAGHVWEDLEIVFRVFDACETVCVLNESLYRYRKRHGSTSDLQLSSEKNMMDMVLAFSHQNAYIEANTPAVFSDAQLNRRRQFLLKRMIKCFLRFYHKTKDQKKPCAIELRKQIIAYGRGNWLKSCSFRLKAAYRCICICPRLVIIAYSPYRTAKRLKKAARSVM